MTGPEGGSGRDETVSRSGTDGGRSSEGIPIAEEGPRSHLGGTNMTAQMRGEVSKTNKLVIVNDL